MDQTNEMRPEYNGAQGSLDAQLKRDLDEAIRNSRIRFIGDPAGGFFEDFAKAQLEFEPVKKNADVDTGTYGYSYAPLENLLAATRPALNRNGLSVLQPFGGSKTGPGYELQTWIAHKSGARLVMETDIPRTDKIQALGSAITYLRRYTVQAVLGINGEDDDDGNQADGNSPRINQRQQGQQRSPQRQQPSASPPARPAPKQEVAPSPKAETTAPAVSLAAPPSQTQGALPATSPPAEPANDGPTVEPGPLTAEQDKEIGDLFKAMKAAGAKVSGPGASRYVNNLVGKMPGALNEAEGNRVIADLRRKLEAKELWLEAPAGGGAS